jgi:mannosyltransferase
VGIGTPSLWYDETATVISATRSWSQLGDMILNVDAVHALYYAMMHLIFDAVGYSPLSLRIPSAIAVGVTAALTVVLGRQLGSGRFALLAGITVCLLPRTTWMGTEGRSYAITAALAVALTIVLVRAIRNSARRWWWLYAALVVLSCVMFLYSALIVVAHTLTMLIWWVSKRAPISTIRRFVVATGLAALITLPFALLVMSESKQLHWLDPLGRHTPRFVFQQQWFLDSPIFAALSWALLVVGAAVMIRAAVTRTSTRTSPSAAAILLPALVVPTAALLLTTLLYLPIYTPRYLTMCVPFVALTMAAAIEAATRFVQARTRASARRSAVGVALPAAVLVVLAVLALPQVIAQRQPLAKEVSSWSQVADFIAAERADLGPDATTAIVYGNVQYHPSASARVIAYSYPDAFEGTIDVNIGTPAAQTGELWETRIPLADGLDRADSADAVYFITSFARDGREQTTAILAQDGWTVTEQWEFSKVHVIRYDRVTPQ